MDIWRITFRQGFTFRICLYIILINGGVNKRVMTLIEIFLQGTGES